MFVAYITTPAITAAATVQVRHPRRMLRHSVLLSLVVMAHLQCSLSCRHAQQRPHVKYIRLLKAAKAQATKLLTDGSVPEVATKAFSDTGYYFRAVRIEFQSHTQAGSRLKFVQVLSVFGGASCSMLETKTKAVYDKRLRIQQI